MFDLVVLWSYRNRQFLAAHAIRAYRASRERGLLPETLIFVVSRLRTPIISLPTFLWLNTSFKKLVLSNLLFKASSHILW